MLAELRERAAAAGVRVLSAHGSELERDFAFGVVRQLFEPILSDAATRDRLLVDAAASARPVFGTPETGGADATFAVLHGLYWLTVNVAGDGPVLLIVDDLHWCDRASLRLLAYLGRRLSGVEALLVAGLRTGEPAIDPMLVAELIDMPGALRLELKPLSEEGVAELVHARLGCRSGAGLHERLSHGNRWESAAPSRDCRPPRAAGGGDGPPSNPLVGGFPRRRLAASLPSCPKTGRP